MCALYKQLFVKFIGGLLDFKSNTGRFEAIPYHERICQICNSDIETVVHLLLECPYYDDIRHRRIYSSIFSYVSIGNLILTYSIKKS